jgi:hypothetical protein
VVAVVALMIWAYGLEGTSAGKQSFAVIMGANLLVGLAAAAAGAVFGFIFGIPRTMSVAERQAVANAVKEAGLTGNTQAMAANTNLERVSDWLTTLLIGATLVQIKPIAEWIGELGSKLFKPDANPNDAIVPVVIILFFCLSFLGIYLITRLYLTSALSLLGGPRSAGGGADNQAELGSQLAAAIESGKTEDIVAALKTFDDAKLPDDVRKDPALNANVARALAKLMSTGATFGRVDPKGELRAAVDNALASPAVADELKKDLGTKSLATGDAALDADISAKLNSAGSSANPTKSDLTVLTERIDAALKSGQVDDVTAAFRALGDTALPAETSEDAAFNAKIVQLAAKIIQLNAAPDRPKAVDALREAATRAAKMPAVAEGLREGFDEGSLSTGDVALDEEIKSKLVST